MIALGGRWLLVLPAWLWFAAALSLGSNTVTGSLTDFQMLVHGFAVGCVWLMMHDACERLPTRAARGLWRSVPCCLACGAVIYASDWPVAVRVWLCEDELRAYVERPDGDEPTLDSPHRVGGYTVYKVDRYGGVVDLFTRHDGWSEGGLTYAPNGLPPVGTQPMFDDDYRSGGYRHLYGPWYRRVIRD